MAKDKKNIKDKKPKFSPYWIYGILIALCEEDIEALDIITNTRVAKVFLTKEAEEKEIHKKSKTQSFLPSTTKLPNYTFEFGSLEKFEEDLDLATKNLTVQPKVEFDKETDTWGNLLMGILPFILLIGVWIFIMRRMSGGGGAGGGGQIFNIGKSKAKLFDQNTEVKTSFKDA